MGIWAWARRVLQIQDYKLKVQITQQMLIQMDKKSLQTTKLFLPNIIGMELMEIQDCHLQQVAQNVCKLRVGGK